LRVAFLLIPAASFSGWERAYAGGRGRFGRLSAKWFVSECPVIRPKREVTIETRSESGSTPVCQLPDLDSKVSGCP